MVAQERIDQYTSAQDMSAAEQRELLDTVFGRPFIEAVSDSWTRIYDAKEHLDPPLFTEVYADLIASGLWQEWVRAWLHVPDRNLYLRRLAIVREHENFDEKELENIQDEARTEGKDPEEVDNYTIEMFKDMIDYRWRNYHESNEFLVDYMQMDSIEMFVECEDISDGGVMPKQVVRTALDDLELPYFIEGRLYNGPWRVFPSPNESEAYRAYVATTALRSGRKALAAP